MSGEFEKENSEILKAFYNDTFFQYWREGENGNWSSIEFYMDGTCNLACKYCYLEKFGDALYPLKIRKQSQILENGKRLVDWLVDNGFTPKIDIFSGEPTIHSIFYELVDYILEKYKDAEHKPKIVVPTNMTFILDEELTAKMESLMHKAKEYGIPLILSASIDGKFMEQNRPFKTGEEPRDDEYYDKVFAFAKKWGIGFHPMLYSDGIEKWKLNFLWFQEMFRKHGLPFDSIYLLEVRNVEWKPEQIKKFGEFIEWLIEWTFNKIYNGDKRAFINFILKGRGYNILGSMGRVGRGIGCSIQSTMFVRLADLTIQPCHRTSYPQFTYGRFIVEDGKVVDIEAKNLELALSIYSFNKRNAPYCVTCPIKNICSYGCLGSQYEITGDLFTPIPTVCQLELTKFMSLIRGFKKVGVLDELMSHYTPEVREDIMNLMELMKDE